MVGHGGEHHDAGGEAKKLIRHTLWMGAAFCIIILVAIGIEFFSKFLLWIKWIELDNYIYWGLYVGSRALVAIDVAGLIGVVAKMTWKNLKRL